MSLWRMLAKDLQHILHRSNLHPSCCFLVRFVRRNGHFSVRSILELAPKFHGICTWQEDFWIVCIASTDTTFVVVRIWIRLDFSTLIGVMAGQSLQDDWNEVILAFTWRPGRFSFSVAFIPTSLADAAEDLYIAK